MEINRNFLCGSGFRTPVVAYPDGAAASALDPAVAMARLLDEWRAVRAAIVETVRTVPGAREPFRRVLKEYSPKCTSPQWDEFFI